MTWRRPLLAATVSVILVLAGGARSAAFSIELPDGLSNAEFWRLSQEFSEAGGTFHSDNFVSNEGRFQAVIPALVSRVRPGGVYLGVGPEQNFSYIAAVRPRLAFIVDIRRGNLQEHLLYKALFELSRDRVEFVARLFSRQRPSGLGSSPTADELFRAFQSLPADHAQYDANLRDVLAHLTRTRGLPLASDDRAGIDYIYRTAFFADGPGLGYRLTGGGPTSQHPTYADLMTTDDGMGKQWSYLASNGAFEVMKALQAKNLVVPVVGDFGGRGALRAIGRYVAERGGHVSAFYLSNVEQYLRQDGKMSAFCANVAALPLDSTSTFIRSMAGRGGAGRGARATGGGLGMFWLDLGAMQGETAACAAGTSVDGR